ncbi:hypothetical protein DFA_00595 [Cavenderia fasciculata]|uniref:Uncharacterized protein n=1 Tax=Cavenderia fasciculata TaxID=261658 RepID=F4PSP0_CACFS|nr:uncharacterized protein DFA_00595 [Cavenderia fasciculata]EGG20732.1 hypothetical protein DFA_00595 [Cavenderia fasciculata]|eukprot:XP_004358582.1 hypothetical protein DFA_00595 [Cavenderia fasciculata]
MDTTATTTIINRFTSDLGKLKELGPGLDGLKNILEELVVSLVGLETTAVSGSGDSDLSLILDLVRTIDATKTEDYRLYVIGWVACSIILNNLLAPTTSVEAADLWRQRIAPLSSAFIKFSSCRGVNDLAFAFPNIDQQDLSNQVLSNVKQRRLLTLSKIIDDLKNGKNVLFALMALRSLVYTGLPEAEWDVVDQVVKSDAVSSILSIAKDSFDVLSLNSNKNASAADELAKLNLQLNQFRLTDQSSKEYVQLVCNESYRLLLNFTDSTVGFEYLVKESTLPIFYNVLSHYSDVELVQPVRSTFYIFEKIVETSLQWGHYVVTNLGLLKLIAGMGKDALRFSNEIVTIFTHLTGSTFESQPLEWSEIANHILPTLGQTLVADQSIARYIVNILRQLLPHPALDTAVLKQYALDQFVIDTLNRYDGTFTDDWYFLLDSCTQLISGILDVRIDPSTDILFTFESLSTVFIKLLTLLDNNQLIDTILFIFSILASIAPKRVIIASKLIQTIQDMVVSGRFQVDDTTNSSAGLLDVIDTKFSINDSSATRILWVLFQTVQSMTPDEMAEIVEQGFLTFFITLYPVVSTIETFMLYCDTLHTIISHDQDKFEREFKTELIDLKFLDLVPKPSSIDPGSTLQFHQRMVKNALVIL